MATTIGTPMAVKIHFLGSSSFLILIQSGDMAALGSTKGEALLLASAFRGRLGR